MALEPKLIKSLYTSIPNEEGIRATRTFLSRAGKTLLILIIVKFLWLILTWYNFILSGVNYLQTNGVSMETKGRDILQHGDCIYPRITRCINGIILIWKETQPGLESFMKEINAVHRSIEFDVSFSKASVSFLDMTVTITPNHSIQTCLKKCLRYSQGLRIKTVCSSINNFTSWIIKVKDQFKARGYNDTLIDSAIQRSSAKGSKEFLQPRTKDDICTPLTFVTTYSRPMSSLKNSLSATLECSCNFVEKPIIAYRRNPDRQQLLDGHRIERG